MPVGRDFEPYNKNRLLEIAQISMRTSTETGDQTMHSSKANRVAITALQTHGHEKNDTTPKLMT